MTHNLKEAIELRKNGKIKESEKILRSMIDEGTNEPNVYYTLGSLLNSTGRFKESIHYLNLATKGNPDHPDYWYSYGNALGQLKQYKAAESAYLQSLSLRDNDVPTLVNLALLYQKTDRFSESEPYAEKAVSIDSKEKNSWLALITAYNRSKASEKGLNAINNALEHFPMDSDLLNLKGDLFVRQEQMREALETYKLALQNDPSSTHALNSIGYVLHFKHPKESIGFYQRSLELEPNSPDALHGLGRDYLKLGSPSDAVPYLMEAINSGGNSSGLFNSLLLSIQYLDAVDEDEIFQLHKEWEDRFAKALFPSELPTRNPIQREKGQPMRIGFVSPDFRDHSVSRFVTALLSHAKDHEIDLYCYSDVIHPNETTTYLETLGGTWRNIASVPDIEVYKIIQEDKIEVLVDLAGHTDFNRLLLFARKPAPVQISWLGYPNTTGLSTIDYRISDAIADPPGSSDKRSSEQIIRLKDGFHCFEPPVTLPPTSTAPCLKNGYITFGSFNNICKINALTVKRWSILLKEIPTAKLLIKNSGVGDPSIQEHWFGVFETSGIDRNRLEFLSYCETLQEHYACYHRVDIGLDTFPYNGTTTTCEALWMGVPVLTIEGDSQRSRTGASLLTHAGFSEWVVRSEAEWLQQACYWNKHPQELNELRLHLREKVCASPIGDGKQFSEKFYKEMKKLSGQDSSREESK